MATRSPVAIQRMTTAVRAGYRPVRRAEEKTMSQAALSSRSTLSSKSRQEYRARFLRYLILGILSVTMLFPVFWMLTVSVKSNDAVFQIPPQWLPTEFVWSNYAKAWEFMNFGRSFANTLMIAVLCAVGQVLSNLCVGYALARLKFPGRKLIFFLIVASMMLPGLIGLIPVFRFFTKLGMYNTFWPLIIPAFLGNPFYTFMLRQFFLGIPKSFDESAKIDGANHMQILMHILLPMVKPAIVVIMIMTLQGAWGDFLNPLIYLADESKWTLALAIKSFTGSYATSWNFFMAGNVMYLLPMLLLFIVAQKYFMEGLGSLNNAGLK